MSPKGLSTRLCNPLYVDPGEYDANNFLDAIGERDIWKENHSSTKGSIDIIEEWLNECDRDHDECRHLNAPQLPTRLIDVGTLQDETPINLRLSTQFTNTSQRYLRYAALSHCWGSAPQLIKLTTHNYDSFQNHIPFDNLPKTFQDAIAITRRLNIRYLWIDSLCILQDDKVDWSYEAAQMASVYMNAHVTLAASASSEGWQGLFYPHSETISLNIDLSTQQASAYNLVSPYTLFIKEDDAFQSPYRGMPLHERGWVLQEWLLSRRVVSFTDSQLHWKCWSCFRTEDGLTYRAQTNSIDIPKPGALLSDIYNCWRIWSQDYSRRILSHQSDKMAALAGLTRYIQHLTNDEPLIGLWKQNLTVDLLWERDFGPAPQTRDNAFPSWTWMCLPCKPMHNHSHLRITGSSFEFVEQRIRWSGEALTSNLELADLVLRAKVLPCVLRKNPEAIVSTQTIGTIESGQTFIGNSKFDLIDQCPENLDAHCILIAQCRVQYERAGSRRYRSSKSFKALHQKHVTREDPELWERLFYRVLITTPVDAKEGIFTRIGVGTIGYQDEDKPLLDPYKCVKSKVIILR